MPADAWFLGSRQRSQPTLSPIVCDRTTRAHHFCGVQSVVWAVRFDAEPFDVGAAVTIVLAVQRQFCSGAFHQLVAMNGLCRDIAGNRCTEERLQYYAGRVRLDVPTLFIVVSASFRCRECSGNGCICSFDCELRWAAQENLSSP